MRSTAPGGVVGPKGRVYQLMPHRSKRWLHWCTGAGVRHPLRHRAVGRAERQVQDAAGLPCADLCRCLGRGAPSLSQLLTAAPLSTSASHHRVHIWHHWKSQGVHRRYFLVHCRWYETPCPCLLQTCAQTRAMVRGVLQNHSTLEGHYASLGTLFGPILRVVMQSKHTPFQIRCVCCAGCHAKPCQSQVPAGQPALLFSAAPGGSFPEPAATLAYLRALLRLLFVFPCMHTGDKHAYAVHL